MSFKELPKEQQEEVARIIRRKKQGGAKVSFSAYFSAESKKGLIDREIERSKQMSAANA
ncbi:MAG: hypothetical protein P8X74_02635 [Reinekea sp.]|jgi:hypothetical protein